MAKWFTIILAILGLSMGIWTVATSDEPLPNPPPARPPSVNPFEHGIAASGVVEASSRNIAIAAPEAGLVTRVFVEVNQIIKRDDPLFALDHRVLDAEMIRAAAALPVAKAELARIEAQPRAEDLPPLRAAVDEAKAQLADAVDQLDRTDESFRKGGATAGEMARRKFTVDATKAALAAAEANLKRMEAGAWAPELAWARTRVAQAEADVRAVQIRIDRMTVRSPIDGSVIKRMVEPGQYASVTPNSPAMIVGNLSTLHVRAQVDEEDAPLLRPGAAGVARLRGAVLHESKLKMIRIEPWAQGKAQLTGASAERVDTRVVDVLFEILSDGKVDDTPVFPGQVVDVFIQTPVKQGRGGATADPPTTTR